MTEEHRAPSQAMAARAALGGRVITTHRCSGRERRLRAQANHPPDIGTDLRTENTSSNRGKVREASKRRKITPEFLQRVAETHTAASGAKVAAVADSFGVDKRTAHRYIAAARKKGLIK